MNTILAPLLRLLLIGTMLAAALPAAAATRAAASPVAATATLDTCSWDRPGHDPFMGDVVSAVDRYQDIPADVRERIKVRMARRDYDDVVSIRRDSIAGRARARYGSAIRDMHFGSHKLCRTVSRTAWSAQTQERGLVYCDSRQCILVPTVCRNVSRITRAEVANEHAEGETPEPLIAPVAMLDPGPAPVPVDALPAPIAPAGDPDVASAENAGYGGGFGGRVGGGPGSFASLSGTGSATAASTEKGVLGHVSSASPSIETSAIAPVPEPETWGLMITGLAALAALRRRQAGSPRPSAAAGSPAPRDCAEHR